MYGVLLFVCRQESLSLPPDLAIAEKSEINE